MTWCRACKHNPCLCKQAEKWRPFVLFWEVAIKKGFTDELTYRQLMTKWAQFISRYKYI